MTMAKERDAGRPVPQDPAPEFNGSAGGGGSPPNNPPAETPHQQAERHRADDALDAQKQQFKSSVDNHNQMLDKLKETQDKTTQQRIETIQKSLSLAGQTVAGLAMHPKAQEGMQALAKILPVIQNASMMLINAYLQGASTKEMKTKINETAEFSQAEAAKIAPALEQAGVDLRTLKSDKDLTRAGITPTPIGPAG